MSISNVELRQRMFGGGSGPKASPAPVSFLHERPVAPSSARPQSRMAILAAWAGKDEPLRPDPPALAARLMSDAMARFQADPPGRLVFADVGKGIAVLLVIFAAVINSAGAMPGEFSWLSGIKAFLQPFALPAFLVYAGMFMHRSRQSGWSVYLGRKAVPVLGACALWIAAAVIASLLIAPNALPPGAQGYLAMAQAQTSLAVLFIILPVFFLLWKLLGRFRTGTILVAAAIMEILHTDQGGVIAVEIMRGFVYFAAGHCLANQFRALARFTRENGASAAAMISVWAAFNALMTFADLPLAYGMKISVLPFASLGLGMAGAAAMVMIGELVARARMAPLFSLMGRKWIAFYAVLPLGIVSLGRVMAEAGLFVTPAQGVAALVTAALAAGLAFWLLELRDPSSQNEPIGMGNR